VRPSDIKEYMQPVAVCAKLRRVTDNFTPPARNTRNEIRAFRAISPTLWTSGQPTEADFTAIRDAGFVTVVNLALPTSDHALPNEGSIVTALGMTYIHLPIKFDSPQKEDFEKFRAIMNTFSKKPIYVHCAANMRVSAFVYLHRILDLGVSPEAALNDLEAIWSPDTVWSTFINTRLEECTPQKS
jgi:uncharacterized protein (TIGR01244 family)